MNLTLTLTDSQVFALQNELRITKEEYEAARDMNARDMPAHVRVIFRVRNILEIGTNPIKGEPS